jgi:hypothetical protein
VESQLETSSEWLTRGLNLCLNGLKAEEVFRENKLVILDTLGSFAL